MRLSNQEERIINHIKKSGSITSIEAFNNYGITRLSDRIFNLKKKGYEIITRMVKGKNRYGEESNFAKYYLKNNNFAENSEERKLGL